MKAIKLYWWRSRVGAHNFGDDLSPILIERLSGRPIQFSKISSCDLISTGSLLNKVVEHTWKRILRHPMHRTAVWGTGSFGPMRSGYNHLNIAAVRGPRTREALNLPGATPIGDPALLLSRFVDLPIKRYRWGIIPHVIHRKDPKILELAKQPRSIIIDLGASDPLEIAKKIASCEFVISSSLHGLIAADAYGIPNIWMQTNSPLVGKEWKFHDYFESVGRTELSVSPPIDLTAYEDKAKRADPGVVASLADGLVQSFPDLGR